MDTQELVLRAKQRISGFGRNSNGWPDTLAFAVRDLAEAVSQLEARVVAQEDRAKDPT
jgi:hypothetical protein